MAYPTIDSYEQWIKRRNPSSVTRAIWHMLGLTEDGKVPDDSGKGHHLEIVGAGPALSEKGVSLNGGYLRATVDAANPTDYVLRDIAGDSGFVFGGFLKPTSADLVNTWAIVSTTRDGTGAPIFHLALNRGRPHVRLYNASGGEIANATWGSSISGSEFSFFGIAVFVSGSTTIAYMLVGDTYLEIYRGSSVMNMSTTNPLQFGQMSSANYYRGELTEWFLEREYQSLGNYWAPAIRAITAAIANPEYANIDFTTFPGQIQMVANEVGEYVIPGEYTSSVIDLGNTFPELGRLEVTGEIPYGMTTVIAETRTSADGTNFSAWNAIDSTGRIQSPNYRYIQLRLQLISNDGYTTPRISSVGFEDYSPESVVNQVKVIPEVRDGNNQRVAFLNKLRSLHLVDANNGEETLSFSMVYDEKAGELENEFKVLIPGNEFYIRQIEDDDEGGKTFRTFHCEAAWYDLATKPRVTDFSFPNSYPDAPLKKALARTGWTLLFVDSGFETRDMVVEGKSNPLKLIRGVQEVWGGDIVFDNVAKTVSLHNKNIESGYAIRKRKNMKRIKRTIDTTGLINKLYPIGANGLTIAPANNGEEAIVNTSWFDERGLTPVIKEAEWEDNRFYSAYHLLERGRERLAQSSRPRLSYEIDILDLSSIPRFAHEIPQLRTQALVDDEDIRTKEWVKIVARELDLLQPWNSKLGLSTQIKELGDEGAALAQESEGRLDNVDAIDRTDMQELMVFNYLQNSRADQGFNHWIQNGNVSIDSQSGVTGRNSFVLTGSTTGRQELAQTFWPSTRESYTISAQIATENLNKAAGAKVGVKVTMHYEDGTSEETWLEL